MPFPSRPRGVLFDYGNTLIPFGQRELDAVNARIAAFVAAEAADPGSDAAREAVFAAMRESNRIRMATNRETDPRDVLCRALAARGVTASDDRLGRGIEVYRKAFLGVVQAGPGMVETLRAARGGGRRTGLLSNYSLSSAIHESLDQLAIRGYFDAVVVSGDVGIVKPDPGIFLLAARRLGLDPRDILYVGDNLRADVAGAAGVGMMTAWITEHLGGMYVFDDPEENAADTEPDLVLPRLTDLIDLLGS